jgi:hypothetical protein
VLLWLIAAAALHGEVDDASNAMRRGKTINRDMHCSECGLSLYSLLATLTRP